MADSSANTILITIKLDDALTAPFDAVMSHIDERVAEATKQTQTTGAQAELPHQTAATAAIEAARVVKAHTAAPVAAQTESAEKATEAAHHVGEAGEEAGGKLAKAAAIGVLGFDALKQSVEGVARLLSGGRISQAIGAFQEIKGVEEFGKSAEEAAEHGGGLMATLGRLAPVAAVAGAAVAALAGTGYELAKSSSESAKEIDGLARVSGMSVEKILALRNAMSQGGVDPQELQLALRGLATRVQESWASISDNVRDSADKQASAVLGVKDSYRGYAEALDNIKSAAIDAAEAQDKLSDAQAGVKSAKFDAEQADIDKSRAEIRWQQLNGQAPDPERVRQLNRREELLKLRRAEERADEAPRKVREAEADEEKAELQPARAQRNLEAAQDNAQRSAIGVRTATNAEHDLKRDQISEIEGGNVDLREVSPQRLMDVMIHRAQLSSQGHPELLMQNLMKEIGTFTEQAQGNPELSQVATGLVRQFYPRGNPATMQRGLETYRREGDAIESSPENQRQAEITRKAIEQGEGFEAATAKRSNATEMTVMGAGAATTPAAVGALDALTAGITSSRDTIIASASRISDGFIAVGSAAKTLAADFAEARQNLSKGGNATPLPASTLVDKDFGDRRTVFGGNLEAERENTRARALSSEPQQEAPRLPAPAESVKQSSDSAKTGLDEVGRTGHEAAGALEHVKNAASSAEAPAKAEPHEATEGHFLGGPILIPSHADGGMIRGPGTRTSDSIFRFLNEGDFVIKASATERLGHGLLDKINAGTFAEGGKVPAYVSDGEFHVKSAAVEKYGLPFMHMLNTAGHANGGPILRLADGGDGDNPWTGKHVGRLSDAQWSGVKRMLNAFNSRPDPGANLAYGEADIPHLPPADSGASLPKYRPATSGPSKKVDAPSSAVAKVAASIAAHKAPEGEATKPGATPAADQAAAYHVAAPQPGQLESKSEPAAAKPEAIGAAAPHMPEVHGGLPPDSIRLPGTLTEHHGKFDADISPSYRNQPTAPTGFDAGNSKPWHPGEMGVGGADFYIPQGDKRVLVQTDRARDKGEMRPAGTRGGVRMDGPLFETSDGPGNVTFSNRERPVYGDSETWRRWERGSVSAGTRLSHESWDRRHPEDNPNSPAYAEGGLIGLPSALRLAMGGFAGGEDDSEPMLRFALGGASMPDGDMDGGGAENGEPTFNLGMGSSLGGGSDLQDMTQQFGGMLTSSLSTDSYDSAVGRAQLQGSLGGSGGTPDITGYHALDVTTDWGKVSTLVSGAAIDSMRASAIGAQLTSTGPKPSWKS